MSKESKLLIYALLGDSFALNRLLLIHSDEVNAYILKHIPHDLKDKLKRERVLFHAYARVSASMSFLPAIDSAFFKRWLLSITRESLTKMVNSCRKGYIDTPSELGLSQGSASESTVRRRKLSKLVVAINALPSEIRSIVKLRYFHGTSDSQIALASKLTQEQVQRLCNKGMEQLRDELGSNTFMLSQ